MNLNTFSSLIVTIWIICISEKCNSYFDMDGGLHEDCYDDFEEYSREVIEDSEDVASDVLFCDHGNKHCSVNLQMTKTYTRTFTGGGSINLSSIQAAMLRLLSVSFSVSVAEATAKGNTYTCTVPPGKKVWLAVQPKFVKIRGKGKYVCCGMAFFTEAKCTNDEESDVELKEPLRKSDGSIDGNVYCRTEKMLGYEENEESHINTETSPKRCRGTNGYSGPYDTWCTYNCEAGYCPPYICTCT